MEISLRIQQTLGGFAGHHPGGSISTAPHSSQSKRGDGVPSSALVLGWLHAMLKICNTSPVKASLGSFTFRHVFAGESDSAPST